MARIPRQLSGTLQLRGNLKVRLPYKPLFDWMLLLLHKIFWDAVEKNNDLAVLYELLEQPQDMHGEWRTPACCQTKKVL